MAGGTEFGVRWSSGRVFRPMERDPDAIRGLRTLADDSDGELVCRGEGESDWRPVNEDQMVCGWMLSGMLAGLASRAGMPISAGEHPGELLTEFAATYRGHRFLIRVTPC